MLAQGDAPKAALSIRKAGALNHEFKGRLEHTTKSSETFFERLAKLQVGIAQVTDKDPLSGLVDYLFQKDGDHYTVARQELDPEVKGITVDGITATEAIALVHLITVRNGQVVIEKTRRLIGPKGSIETTVKQATREVSFNSDGRIVVVPIANGQSERGSQPKKNPKLNVSEPSASTMPEAPKTKPVTPREVIAHTSLLTWLLAIFAALGAMFWLLRKGTK